MFVSSARLLLVDSVSRTSIEFRPGRASIEVKPGREQVDFQAIVGSFWDVEDTSELFICFALEKYCIDRVF